MPKGRGHHAQYASRRPQTPYELMRKNHRSAQRQVEKEFGQMQVRRGGRAQEGVARVQANTSSPLRPEHPEGALERRSKRLGVSRSGSCQAQGRSRAADRTQAQGKGSRVVAQSEGALNPIAQIDAIQPSPRLDVPMRSRLGLIRDLETFGDSIDANGPEWQRCGRDHVNPVPTDR